MPDPQTSSGREPPRKVPPTAVGVVTPPPPRPPRRSLRRASRSRSAFVLVGWTVAIVSGGVIVGASLPFGVLIELVTGLGALQVITQVRCCRRRTPYAVAHFS